MSDELFTHTASVTEVAEQVKNDGYVVQEAINGAEYVRIFNIADTDDILFEFEDEAAVRYIKEAELIAVENDVDIVTALLANAQQYVDSLNKG